MTLTVAVLKEHAEGERRVALDPSGVKKLAGRGLRVLMQTGAGELAGFADRQYAEAEFAADASTILGQADIYLFVQVPPAARLGELREGALARCLGFMTTCR